MIEKLEISLTQFVDFVNKMGNAFIKRRGK